MQSLIEDLELLGIVDERLDKLRAFKKLIEEAPAKNNEHYHNSNEKWQMAVESTLQKTWQEIRTNSDKNKVLTLFGFTERQAEFIACQMTHENSKKVQEPFGDYVLSMFMKGFMLITIPGCFADVCNTIFAVRGKEESSNIETTEAVIDDFINDVIKKCNYSELWIPTHVAHDAEKDDELSLVLLEYLNVCKHQHDRVPSISQLAQIPAKIRDGDVLTRLACSGHRHRRKRYQI